MKTLLVTMTLALGCGLLATGQTAERRAEPGAIFTPKLVAPIGIAHSFSSEPRIGQALEITLTITPAVALSGAVLSLGADDPLALIEPLGVVDLGRIEATESATVLVTVLPLVEQTHYLRVAVSGDMGGQQQSRNIVVAIRLPTSELRKSASDVTGNKTQTVRSFESIESVR